MLLSIPSFIFSSFFIYSFLTIILILLILNFIHSITNNKLPPGPFHLPLIGNFIQLNLCYPYRSFIYWKQKFGPIYTVWLPQPCLVIAGYKQISELLVNSKYADIFSDRPTFSYSFGVFNNFQPDGDGIILSRQKVWKKNRNFALSAFRNLGMGRQIMETRINYHKDILISRLKEIVNNKNGIVNDMSMQFDFYSGNIIQSLLIGRFHEYNDPVATIQMLIVNRWPLFRWIFPAYWRYIRQGFELQRFFLNEVDIHIAKINKDGKVNVAELEDPECFVEAYLQSIIAEKQSLEDPAIRLTIAICSADLWAGGIETVASTLTWAIIYLLNYPDIQLKLQEEFDKQLGDQPFRYSDHLELPYFRAFIDELQRIVNILPWNIPHSTSKEVSLGEWIIPKDTIVMVQHGSVHLDPLNFPQPEVFRPERFLNLEGKYKGSDLLKPYGSGKRICLGDSLAKMELFIMLASLLRNFNFELLDGKLPSLNRTFGMLNHASPFKV